MESICCSILSLGPLRDNLEHPKHLESSASFRTNNLKKNIFPVHFGFLEAANFSGTDWI